jgi:hypothetical protein
MTKATNLLIIIGTVTLVAFVTGCSTTKQTENLLSAAGFNTIPANTPERQAHLKTLPPHKITMVVRDGKTYYVYPDQAHQVLYVGQQPQYEEYQKLRLENQMAEDQVQAAEMNSEAGWGAWGGFGGVMAVPVYRR